MMELLEVSLRVVVMLLSEVKVLEESEEVEFLVLDVSKRVVENLLLGLVFLKRVRVEFWLES